MRFLSVLRSEPAVVGSLVAAAVGLATAFGLDLSAEQTAGITSALTVVVGLFIRANVTPASVDETQIEAENFTEIAAQADLFEDDEGDE